jgi:hypothetical protein
MSKTNHPRVAELGAKSPETKTATTTRFTKRRLITGIATLAVVALIGGGFALKSITYEQRKIVFENESASTACTAGTGTFDTLGAQSNVIFDDAHGDDDSNVVVKVSGSANDGCMITITDWVVPMTADGAPANRKAFYHLPLANAIEVNDGHGYSKSGILVSAPQLFNDSQAMFEPHSGSFEVRFNIVRSDGSVTSYEQNFWLDVNQNGDPEVHVE